MENTTIYVLLLANFFFLFSFSWPYTETIWVLYWNKRFICVLFLFFSNNSSSSLFVRPLVEGYKKRSITIQFTIALSWFSFIWIRRSIEKELEMQLGWFPAFLNCWRGFLKFGLWHHGMVRKWSIIGHLVPAFGGSEVSNEFISCVSFWASKDERFSSFCTIFWKKFPGQLTRFIFRWLQSGRVVGNPHLREIPIWFHQTVINK